MNDHHSPFRFTGRECSVLVRDHRYKFSCDDATSRLRRPSSVLRTSVLLSLSCASSGSTAQSWRTTGELKELHDRWSHTHRAQLELDESTSKIDDSLVHEIDWKTSRERRRLFQHDSNLKADRQDSTYLPDTESRVVQGSRAKLTIFNDNTLASDPGLSAGFIKSVAQEHRSQLFVTSYMNLYKPQK